MHSCHVLGEGTLVGEVCLTHSALELILQATQGFTGPLVHLAVAVEATAGNKSKATDVTDERAAGGVGLHVGVESVTVGKSAATNGAAVLMSILVEGQVLLQLGSLSKSLQALLAAVGPLPSVSQHMSLEMGWVQKTLATVVTAVRSFQPMNTVVGLQGYIGGESLSTLVTLIWPQVMFLSQMTDVITLELDDFTALVTFVALWGSLIWRGESYMSYSPTHMYVKD